MTVASGAISCVILRLKLKVLALAALTKCLEYTNPLSPMTITFKDSNNPFDSAVMLRMSPILGLKIILK